MSKRDVLRAAIENYVKNSTPTKVIVPDIGEFFVRELTLGEVEAQGRDSAAKDDPHRIARGIARILVDEDGARLYDHNDAADIEALSQVPFSRMEKILEAANKANGLDEKAAEKN